MSVESGEESPNSNKMDTSNPEESHVPTTTDDSKENVDSGDKHSRQDSTSSDLSSDEGHLDEISLSPSLGSLVCNENINTSNFGRSNSSEDFENPKGGSNIWDFVEIPDPEETEDFSKLSAVLKVDINLDNMSSSDIQALIRKVFVEEELLLKALKDETNTPIFGEIVLFFARGPILREMIQIGYLNKDLNYKESSLVTDILTISGDELDDDEDNDVNMGESEPKSKTNPNDQVIKIEDRILCELLGPQYLKLIFSYVGNTASNKTNELYFRLLTSVLNRKYIHVLGFLIQASESSKEEYNLMKPWLLSNLQIYNFDKLLLKLVGLPIFQNSCFASNMFLPSLSSFSDLYFFPSNVPSLANMNQNDIIGPPPVMSDVNEEENKKEKPEDTKDENVVVDDDSILINAKSVQDFFISEGFIPFLFQFLEAASKIKNTEKQALQGGLFEFKKDMVFENVFNFFESCSKYYYGLSLVEKDKNFKIENYPLYMDIISPETISKILEIILVNYSNYSNNIFIYGMKFVISLFKKYSFERDNYTQNLMTNNTANTPLSTDSELEVPMFILTILQLNKHDFLKNLISKLDELAADKNKETSGRVGERNLLILQFLVDILNIKDSKIVMKIIFNQMLSYKTISVELFNQTKKNNIFLTLINILFKFSNNNMMHNVILSFIEIVLENTMSMNLKKFLIEETPLLSFLIQQGTKALCNKGHVVRVSNKIVELVGELGNMNISNEDLKIIAIKEIKTDWENFVSNFLQKENVKENYILGGPFNSLNFDELNSTINKKLENKMNIDKEKEL